MTAGILGRSAPLALIAHDALRANTRAVLAAARDAGPAIADLRRDAWGHGAAAVARVLLEAGVDAVLVDEDAVSDLGGGNGRALTRTDAPLLDSGALFGLPADGALAGIPVMRLSGPILSVKALRAGEGVSYGYTHRAAADTNVALVAGGYAQGVVRALGNRASVVVKDVRRPIIGRIAMDACVIDLGPVDAARGDQVVFFGDPAAGEPGLSEWSTATGWRAAELACAVGVHTAREHRR